VFRAELFDINEPVAALFRLELAKLERIAAFLQSLKPVQVESVLTLCAENGGAGLFRYCNWWHYDICTNSTFSRCIAH
jgi:hypothetical protein